MEDPITVISDENNQPALRDLIRQLRSPVGIIPYIGAGMSAPAGFRGWTDFLMLMAEKIGADKDVKQHTDAGRYEEAAQLLEGRLGERDFHDQIRDCFGDHRIKEDGLEAVALLTSIAPGPVVTTNFDGVLELVFKSAHRKFDQIVKGVEIDTFGEALDLNRHVLLKVHGDVEDRTHRILTLNEYERSYGPRSGEMEHLLSKQLELLAIRGKFLFLGCSLVEDRLMEVLARINKRYQNVVHYALLQKPSDPDAFGRRVKFLSERGIRPIWYPENEFKNIPVFLRHLVEQLSIPAVSKAGEEIADRERALITQSSRLLAGRESELALLDSYAGSAASAIQIVTGDAGMGKTALLAGWVSEHAGRSRIANHFFSERNRLTSVRDAYLHLLYQLSADSSAHEDLAGASEEKLRQDLYSRIKQITLQHGARLILVFDGLDEAEQPFWPPFPLPVPSGLRVIASARSGETKYLEGWGDGATPLTLAPLGRNAVRSWLRQVGENGEDESLVQSLLDRTGGFPLYLHYLVQELLEAVNRGEDPRTIISETPKGFTAYVRDQLRRLSSDGSGFRGDARNVFALLSVVLGAISEADLEALTGLTALDLPSLPVKMTRWFQIRSNSDGSITCGFAHPELAAEFSRALGKPARDKEKELIDYCHRWAEHDSPYALEFLPDHLRRAKRLPELFDLARGDAFFAALRRAFPNDLEKTLKPVRTALSDAASRDDAAAMAEFALAQARRISELSVETPIDVLSRGTLSAALELADLREPGRAILWHLLVAAELQQKNDRESALRALLRLREKSIAPLSGWHGVSAAGLLLPLASLDAEAFVELSRGLLPGYGQSVEVTGAIHELANRLVEGGKYRLALEVDEPGRDIVRAAIVKHLASGGDVAGAETELRKISGARLGAEAKAKLAVARSLAGDSQPARALLESAANEARRAGKGHAEVAVEYARLGYFAEALDLLEDVKGAEIYLARALKDVAVLAHGRGDDSGPALNRLERLVRAETDRRWKPGMLAQLAIANFQTSRESAAHEILDELVKEAARAEAPAVQSLVTIAGALAKTNAGDAERLFKLALEYVRKLSSREGKVTADIARGQADAGLFTGAAETLIQAPDSPWRTYAVCDIAERWAAHGGLDEALGMLDPAGNDSHKQALATIASNFVAHGNWPTARRLFIDLLCSPDPSGPFKRPEQDKSLARVAVVLARQNRPAEARAALESITDADSKAEALRDLAVACADAGDIAAARSLVDEIGEGREYDREIALGRVALKLARQGGGGVESILGTMEGLRRYPWHAATDLLTLLREQNALGLIDEFHLYEAMFQFAWWEKRDHIAAIRCVALAKAGDLESALSLAKELSDRRVLATFERITPIAREQGRLEELFFVAQRLKSTADSATALTGIAIGQIRLNCLAEAEQSLKLALSTVGKIAETHNRQYVLVDIGVAYQVAGERPRAEQIWTASYQLESWHYSHNRASTVAPLHPDGIAADIVQRLAAAGLHEEAIERVSYIDDLYKRGSVLERIADGFTAGGEFSREVLRVAQGVVLRRADWTSTMIDALVRAGDKGSAKSLLATAAQTVDAAYHLCGALAELYPEQVASISAVVRR